MFGAVGVNWISVINRGVSRAKSLLKDVASSEEATECLAGISAICGNQHATVQRKRMTLHSLIANSGVNGNSNGNGNGNKMDSKKMDMIYSSTGGSLKVVRCTGASRA